MAWYDEEARTQQVSTYDNDKAVDRDLKGAVPLGWTIKEVSGPFGQLEVGGTMTRLAAAGGFDILFASDAAKGRMSVSWDRDPGRVMVLSAESRVARMKSEYDQSESQVAGTVKKVVDLQARVLEGTRAADNARSLSEALAERARAALRHRDAIARLAEATQALMGAYGQAGEPAPTPIDIAGRWQVDAERLEARAAADQVASDAMREFARVAQDADEAAKEAQEAANSVGQLIMRIAESERRVMTARDDASKDRAERELADRKSQQERGEALRRETEDVKVSKMAIRDDLRGRLPVIATY